MKAKYLGLYNLDFIENEELDGVMSVFNNDADESDYYECEQFMRTNDDDSLFDAVAGETNTSAIAAKFITHDGVKLWRIY